MRRPIRYAVALSTAAAVVAVAAALGASAPLLAGIAQVYAAGTAVALRPEVRRAATGAGGPPDAPFVAVTAFGVLSIAQGLSPEFRYGAAILAVGLVYFGLVCGIWTISGEPSPRDGESVREPR